jgi:hypothetical protein
MVLMENKEGHKVPSKCSVIITKDKPMIQAPVVLTVARLEIKTGVILQLVHTESKDH